MSTPSWPNKPLYTADLAGKTVMVIGANTGIGIEAAKHFAERVIITCRDDEKCSIAVESIKKESGPNIAAPTP